MIYDLLQDMPNMADFLDPDVFTDDPNDYETEDEYNYLKPRNL